MTAIDKPNDLSLETLERLKRLSNLMDRAFVIPGTGVRFGVDSIVGLVPVVGDTLTVAISGYIYSFARKAGVPRRKRLRMIWNIFLDWLIGLIPIVGDVFDVAFKANSKNVRIIVAHVEDRLDAEALGRPHERAA